MQSAQAKAVRLEEAGDLRSITGKGPQGDACEDAASLSDRALMDSMGIALADAGAGADQMRAEGQP